MKYFNALAFAILFSVTATGQTTTTLPEKALSQKEASEWLKIQVKKTRDDFERIRFYDEFRGLKNKFEAPSTLKEIKIGEDAKQTTCYQISTTFGKKKDRQSLLYFAISNDQSSGITIRHTYFQIRDVRIYLLPTPWYIRERSYYFPIEFYAGPYRGPNDRIIIPDPDQDPMQTCLNAFSASKQAQAVYLDNKQRTLKQNAATKVALEKSWAEAEKKQEQKK